MEIKREKMTKKIPDIQIAKVIYEEIIKSIRFIEKTNNIFCAIPPFIELDGVIYQHSQCLNSNELYDWGARGGQQMLDVSQGKVRFYSDQK